MPPLTPLAELLADARIAGLVAVTTPALLIDPEGKLLFANPAGLALIGANNSPGGSHDAEPQPLGRSRKQQSGFRKTFPPAVRRGSSACD